MSLSENRDYPYGWLTTNEIKYGLFGASTVYFPNCNQCMYMLRYFMLQIGF